MSELEEKQKIQKITDLLEKGGTMLANHHNCGAPMFRYMGKVMCPVCEIGGENSAQSGKDKITEKTQLENKSVPVSTKPVEKSQSQTVLTSSDIKIKNQILNKVHSLAEGIEDETDLQRLRDKMECIELGIKILELLKK